MKKKVDSLYKDLSSKSGVSKFYKYRHNGPLYIEFKDGSVYKYDKSKPGPHKLKKMNSLSQKGQGLNTYINKSVRKNFSKRLQST